MRSCTACREPAQSEGARRGVAFATRLVLLGALLAGHGATAGAAEPPTFLPAYYAAALDIGDPSFVLVGSSKNGQSDQAVYRSKDGTFQLALESTPCKLTQCEALFENALGNFNQLLSANGGTFESIDAFEIVGKARDSEMDHLVIAVRHVSSVQGWIFSARRGKSDGLAGRTAIIRSLANRQRYEEARGAGNVLMGRWGAQILDHATDLLVAGKRETALAVLREVIATSPALYEAHAAYFRNADDAASRRASAQVVFENAETISLIREAADILDERLPSIADFPLLEPNEAGLQVILIPLPPVDAVFLRQAADLYEEITGVPAKIRRLPNDWQFGAPDRLQRQREAEDVLARLHGIDVDFSAWTLADYVDKLRSAFAETGAFDHYYLTRLIEDIEAGPGQILVDGYVDTLNRVLEPYRSGDRRTMYVGVTRRSIYSGDANYLFSIYHGDPGYGSSIMSYSVMLAETFGESHQSRRRLVERMAKELVPASFKALQIPRSVDPSCPYSYSGGIARTDEKSLRLSAPVVEAIEALR